MMVPKQLALSKISFSAAESNRQVLERQKKQHLPNQKLYNRALQGLDTQKRTLPKRVTEYRKN